MYGRQRTVRELQLRVDSARAFCADLQDSTD